MTLHLHPDFLLCSSPPRYELVAAARASFERLRGGDRSALQACGGRPLRRLQLCRRLERRRVQAALLDREGGRGRVGWGGDGRGLKVLIASDSVGVPDKFLAGAQRRYTHTFAAVAFTNDGEQK